MKELIILVNNTDNYKLLREAWRILWPLGTMPRANIKIKSEVLSDLKNISNLYSNKKLKDGFINKLKELKKEKYEE